MENKSKFLSELNEYTTDELIYKRYYELRDSDAERRTFLAQLSRNLVEELNLMIPELPYVEEPRFLSESTIPSISSIHSADSVIFVRHQRYTPAFVHQHDYFEIAYTISNEPPVPGVEKSSKQDRRYGIAKRRSHGLALPYFDLVLSIKAPIKRSVRPSKTRQAARMIPATAMLIPTTSV